MQIPANYLVRAKPSDFIPGTDRGFFSVRRTNPTCDGNACVTGDSFQHGVNACSTHGQIHHREEVNISGAFLCGDSLPSTFIYLFLDQRLASNDTRPASVTHDSNVSSMASSSFPAPPVTADRSSAPRSASRLRKAPNRLPKFRIIQYDPEKHLSRASNPRTRRKPKQVREPAQVRKYSPQLVLRSVPLITL